MKVVSPLDTPVLSIEATRHIGQFSLHELYNLLQIVLTAAQVCLSDRGFALPPGSASHLPQHSRADKLSAHARIVQDDSSRRSMIIRKESEWGVGLRTD